MSLLAPLFALGALAIVLPILFHLIQRRPRGQQLFSSLMFLAPSPPRITRRSRLNHLLLLALRASALVLIALAFARPFMRSLQQLNLSGPERQVVILVDRSASMQRSSLWDQARREVEAVLDGLRPTDRVALMSFDHRLQEVVAFGDGGQDPAANVRRIRQEIARLRPGWGATDLGGALVEAIDRLRSRSTERPGTEQRIVLISDVQAGSRLTALESATWPPDIRLEVRPVATDGGNATLAWMPAEEDTDLSQLRVRVTNDPQGKRDVLQLVWHSSERGGADVPVKSVHVAPGQSRVVTIPRKSSGVCLKLVGDDHPFDNLAYLAPVKPAEKTLLFVGDARDEPQRQIYFLRRAQLGTLQHPVRVEVNAGAAAPSLTPGSTPLVVVTTAVDDSWTAPLRDYLTAGGRVLIVMDPDEFFPDASRDTGPLAALLGLESLQTEPVQADDYAILSHIDFQHPLFQPFAEPPYNDFTKIRFWRYHRVSASHEQPWSVLARFDDGSVALGEQQIGEGRLWILATGWSPETSQLALSTKFVPLLVSMLGKAIESTIQPEGLLIGQPIDFGNRKGFEQVRDPRGQVVELKPEQTRFAETGEVGIYEFSGPSATWQVAVNLDPLESRVEPLDIGELEKRGVLLGSSETHEEFARRQRQMRDVELESRQKLWRWLLVAALCALAVETYVAGRSHRTPQTND